MFPYRRDMKRYYLLLGLVLFLGSCSEDDPIPQPTSPTFEKGIFGMRNGSQLKDLGAAYTRIIVWDTDLQSIFNAVDSGTPLTSIPEYQQIKGIHDAGVKIIVSLRWPDQNSSDPELYDRVPLGADRSQSLDLLRRFLNEIGPLLEIYSIQNEVGGLGPGTYSSADMQNSGNGSPAVNWWKDIYHVVDSARSANSYLSQIEISSPCPIQLERMVFNPNSVPQLNQDFFHETIQFANQYCDYIDLHFNILPLQDYPQVLSFIEPLVQKSLISTEWSEVQSARDYLVQSIDSWITSRANQLGYSFPSNLAAMEDLVNHSYTSPMPSSLWNEIVDSSGYEPDFMASSGELLADAGFVILCWNSGWQEGKPDYDLRSIRATLSVSDAINEVDLLKREFEAL